MSNMKIVAYLNKLCKQGVGSLDALGMLKEELGINNIIDVSGDRYYEF